MKYMIVTDLEATCDNNPNFDRRNSEIIEIGAVVVDENLQVVDSFSSFVKPLKSPTLTAFCKNLTKIQQSDIDSAPTFVNAYYKFEDFCLKYSDRTFASWGNYDFNKLISECRKNKIDFMFSEGVNLKEQFALTQGVRGKGPGLSAALASCDLRFIGTLHRGIDDARNIARMIPYALHGKQCKDVSKLYHKASHKKPYHNKNRNNPQI